ncbi:MAG TPA: PfaB family protein [Nostocaceae cyanobacterium]|nr:PfaB family protein [Nostocaceae cyanobacterium]
MTKQIKTYTPKLAITGIDCFLNNCQNSNEFEQIIYEGNQSFTPIITNENGNPEIELPITPEKIKHLSTTELLTLKVIHQACKNANFSANTKIAVINLSELEISPQLVGYIHPELSLVTQEKSVLSALDLAHQILHHHQTDAVVITAVNFAQEKTNITPTNPNVQTLIYDKNATENVMGEGAAAIVVQLHHQAKQSHQRIYAVIDSISIIQNHDFSSTAVKQACEAACQIANIQINEIGYLEIFANGNSQQDTDEIQGLISAYATKNPYLSCALGSIKANIGDTNTASGIFSLVKTALCLYHRYIPAVPQWTDAKNPEIWHENPFYVATESKPWFVELGAKKRIAAISYLEQNRNYAHIILSEAEPPQQIASHTLQRTPFYLLAIAFDHPSSLVAEITTLQQTITDSPSLAIAASQTFQKYQQRQPATYTLVILGHNHQEITRELQRAIQGVKTAFDTGKDWLTPIGSYFTPQPQGKKGKVAFVYPGSFTSYIGLGRNLFRLFPQIYDDPLIKNVYNRVANIEKLLYPRSFKKLSKRQLETLEQKLIDDPVSMLESEIGFAGFFTAILQNHFQIQPQAVFGYSLGETSMMLAQGVWNSFQESSNYLNSSPLFKTRLSGPKNAVREYWGLPTITDQQSPEFWSNYILKFPASQLREIITKEQRVYIPLINTPEEVVIAGETQACQKLIDNLNCVAFPTSINHVIHCKPMQSEYPELVKVNDLPIQNIPTIPFYSAFEYAPLKIENQTIAHKIATTLCQQLDFPRLVNRVYHDNIRIFIEVGVGGNCSRWISETLQQKEHVTVSLNRRGMDDHTSIIRALAKLVSHQVKLDLSPLYFPTSSDSQPQIQLTNPITNQHQNKQEISKSNYFPLLPLSKNHQQKLNENNARLTKAHTLLLQSRQQSLQKINILLQQQLDFHQKIINQTSK